MKKLNFTDKIIFFFNSIIAAMLLLSYLLPYVQPAHFAYLSVLSLTVPLLIILNILFVLFWFLKSKKQLFVSLFVLILGYSFVFSLYKFSSSTNAEDDNGLTIMNYNVRLFNLYNWLPENDVEAKIVSFIKNEQPDIICFQEYFPHDDVDLSFYKYKYEELSGQSVKNGQAIFSKYPIIKTGSIDFPNTENNAIYADVVKGTDTIRIYNVHLQSSGINADVQNLNTENSERLFKRVATTFKKQQSQTELFLSHKEKSPYKMIICGDFNNTAYSYVYRKVKGKLVDAFEEAGKGFGRTFDFKYFPVRIDFILVDESFKVNGFKNYEEKLSDHYPIMTSVSFEK
ncbi:endonuclease/exonuclease/phosphatase family protein [Flavobacteriaceae bacterium AH-315-B10]|nr:endonuclease/exonuclease/phosphatase family protein [Flavobacteriaceae bacterium AH-315-B10]